MSVTYEQLTSRARFAADAIFGAASTRRAAKRPSGAGGLSAPGVWYQARLRPIVGYIGGASLGFVMLVCAGELALKPGIRPTDLLATMMRRSPQRDGRRMRRYGAKAISCSGATARGAKSAIWMTDI